MHTSVVKSIHFETKTNNKNETRNSHSCQMSYRVCQSALSSMEVEYFHGIILFVLRACIAISHESSHSTEYIHNMIGRDAMLSRWWKTFGVSFANESIHKITLIQFEYQQHGKERALQCSALNISFAVVCFVFLFFYPVLIAFVLMYETLLTKICVYTCRCVCESVIR